MKLLEHESKLLFQKAGVPVPKSELIHLADTPGHQNQPQPQTQTQPQAQQTQTQANSLPLSLPLVLKSQVPVGGRGKAGGVLITKTASELTQNIATLSQLAIKGHTPQTLLAEELIHISKEFYLSFTINRSLAAVELIAHKEGGMEIESHETHDFFRRTINQSVATDQQFQRLSDELADYLNLDGQVFTLEKLLKNAYRCFNNNDCTLLEINPLILTQEGSLIAGDGKITLDDSAAFRHPEWQDFEEKRTEANFVSLHNDGNVATIANGAGLAMATVDAVADTKGLKPANFLDIGGGASSATVLKAFHRIMEFPNIHGIVINIFAGITRCDEVAKAIIEAKNTVPTLPPLFIRLSGTNVEQAKTLLAAEDIPLLPTLQSCLTAAAQTIQKQEVK